MQRTPSISSQALGGASDAPNDRQGLGLGAVEILVGAVFTGALQAFLHCIHLGMQICWALPPFRPLQTP